MNTSGRYVRCITPLAWMANQLILLRQKHIIYHFYGLFMQIHIIFKLFNDTAIRIWHFWVVLKILKANVFWYQYKVFKKNHQFSLIDSTIYQENLMPFPRFCTVLKTFTLQKKSSKEESFYCCRQLALILSRWLWPCTKGTLKGEFYETCRLLWD